MRRVQRLPRASWHRWRSAWPSPTRPAALSTSRRLPARACCRRCSRRCARRPKAAAALRQGCRRQVREVVQRITVAGEALLAKGGDQRDQGWDDQANLLWEIERRGIMSPEELAAASGRSRNWAARQGLTELHRLLYPTEPDLAAVAILLALDTGLEPDSLRNLTVDCRKNPPRGYGHA